MAISRGELDLGLWRIQASFLGYSEGRGPSGKMSSRKTEGWLRVAALQGGVRPPVLRPEKDCPPADLPGPGTLDLG